MSYSSQHQALKDRLQSFEAGSGAGAGAAGSASGMGGGPTLVKHYLTLGQEIETVRGISTYLDSESAHLIFTFFI